MGISIFKENDKFNESKIRMKEVYLSDQRPWVVGYSGGKDSSVTVQLVIQMLNEMSPDERHKPVYVITSDTLVENPMILAWMDESLDKIQQVANQHELPIETKKVYPKSDNTFWVNLIGKGYPSPRQKFRWCTDRMKIQPANQFILDKVSEHGEVIMVLGVREDESQSRGESIRAHQIEGSVLMKHSTLPNAFTYGPIRSWTTDDVWEFLMDEPTFGEDNHRLLQLYQDSDGECPLMVDGDTKKVTCGNSRFGCWTCTVVNDDKSLGGFINNGEKWLIPLLEFRNYLVEIRNDRTKRQKCQRNGRVYTIPNLDGIDKNKAIRVKEDELDEYLATVDLRNTVKLDLIVERDVGLLFPEERTLGLGPFLLEVRKELLQRLLEIQEQLREGGRDVTLIRPEEVEMIHQVWEKELKSHSKKAS